MNGTVVDSSMSTKAAFPPTRPRLPPSVSLPLNLHPSTPTAPLMAATCRLPLELWAMIVDIIDDHFVLMKMALVSRSVNAIVTEKLYTHIFLDHPAAMLAFITQVSKGEEAIGQDHTTTRISYTLSYIMATAFKCTYIQTCI
ncbi:hypothetical protein IAT40_003382 [Kwoniella sp. CBS 6097]